MPMDQSDPIENYRSIRKELVQYNKALGIRPELIVVSKAELPGAEELVEQLKEETGGEVMLISAATGQGLPPLVNRIDQMITEHRKVLEEEESKAKAEAIAEAQASE